LIEHKESGKQFRVYCGNDKLMKKFGVDLD